MGDAAEELGLEFRKLKNRGCATNDAINQIARRHNRSRSNVIHILKRDGHIEGSWHGLLDPKVAAFCLVSAATVFAVLWFKLAGSQKPEIERSESTAATVAAGAITAPGTAECSFFETATVEDIRDRCTDQVSGSLSSRFMSEEDRGFGYIGCVERNKEEARSCGVYKDWSGL